MEKCDATREKEDSIKKVILNFYETAWRKFSSLIPVFLFISLLRECLVYAFDCRMMFSPCPRLGYTVSSRYFNISQFGILFPLLLRRS